jgi:hypothetical protein
LAARILPPDMTFRADNALQRSPSYLRIGSLARESAAYTGRGILWHARLAATFTAGACLLLKKQHPKQRVFYSVCSVVSMEVSSVNVVVGVCCLKGHAREEVRV